MPRDRTESRDRAVRIGSLIVLPALLLLVLTSHADEPGLPFSEEFDDVSLRDSGGTNAF